MRSLDFFGGMYHFYPSVRLLYLDVFTDHNLRAEVKRQSHDQSQTYLADNLELAVQSFLIFLEYLDVIVGKPQ